MFATSFSGRLAILFLVLGVLGGCNTRSVDGPSATTRTSKATSLGSKFLLKQEPNGVTTIAKALEGIDEDSAVTLVGRVRKSDQTSPTAGTASLVLREILKDDHRKTPGHDPSTCPFCKHRAAKAPSASVQFVDQQGKVIPVGVDELFGIEAGDEVVVRGKGEYLPELSQFIVTADGIYVRRAGT